MDKGSHHQRQVTVHADNVAVVQSLVQAGQLLYMTEIDGYEQPKTDAWMMKPLSAGCENTVVTSTPDLGHARFFSVSGPGFLFVCLFICLWKPK